MWPLLVPVFLLVNESSWMNFILGSIYKDNPYETVLLLKHSQQNDAYGLERFPYPVLKFDETMNFRVKGSFNSEMLVLIWQSGNSTLDADLWQALDRSFLNMRQVRVILFRKWEKSPTIEIANTAQHLRFLNVAVIGKRKRIYRLQPYAPQKWLEINPERSPIFTKVRNFYGRYILTLPDQFPPRSIVYRNPKTRNLQMSGYVYKFLLHFTQKFNFTFRWQRPIKPGEHISLIELRNMTMNGTINMPISLCGFELSTEFGVFSNVFDLEDWVVIVPRALEIPTADVYVVMVSGQFLIVLFIFYGIFTILDTCFGPLLLQKRVDWSNLVLNERMISGIMGQSCKMSAKNTISSRVTNATLFLLGMVLSTLYAAHLKTLLTKRPTSQQITNFQQLRDSSVNIYFDKAEQFYLFNAMQERPIHVVMDKLQFEATKEFNELRSRLNRSNAFSALTSEWLITAKTQELFKQPVYTIQPELQIVRMNVMLSFVMQSNSIYEHELNSLIGQVQSAGIVQFWKQQTLREMITMGMISQKDPFQYIPFREFKVGDLLWIWILLASCLVLAFFTFLCELLVNCFIKTPKLRPENPRL
ncbi:uncharacterized protein LOC108087407 [Drosophila ficusphila]|uniref:uncharacterized protein LOC108087407 n=1 Tax=Drosophila ficusphila TaxID=30025 RepID=UPI0007E721AB|nr:uncharacterized protein LOC108087407 [Drosophila ficusphila]